MKLSDIVAYKELLESITPAEDDMIVARHYTPVVTTVKDHAIQFNDLLENLKSSHDGIVAAMQQFGHDISSIKSALDEMIWAMEPHYMAKSYQLYDEMMANDSVAHILSRQFGTTPEVTTYLQSRVQFHSDWHHAGLVIRPGNSDWIANMVACDPMYVVDTDYALLEPIKEKFNPVYLNRLRLGLISENQNSELLHMIPDDQIGFCLAYNFFHFKPFDIMQRYLEEIYRKLKPGGHLAFTFNDCDRRGAVCNAERMFMCYTPGRLVVSLCEKLGFVVRSKYIVDAACTWLEVYKPGTRSSLRGGQALAKIIAKS